MDLGAFGRTIELADGLVSALIVDAAPRPLLADRVLAGLLSNLADVPAADVDLDHRCQVCGQHHGHPSVLYPNTPSGGVWYGHAISLPTLAVAAASNRRAVGVAIEPVSIADAPQVDDAAFHPDERRSLDEVDIEQRMPARAQLWARKSALIEAAGHIGVIEPARIALSLPGEGEEGHVVLAADTLDSAVVSARILDLAVPGAYVASVAVLG
jgi:4'-phosphopantetheinyl transferase